MKNSILVKVGIDDITKELLSVAYYNAGVGYKDAVNINDSKTSMLATNFTKASLNEESDLFDVKYQSIKTGKLITDFNEQEPYCMSYAENMPNVLAMLRDSIIGVSKLNDVSLSVDVNNDIINLTDTSEYSVTPLEALKDIISRIEIINQKNKEYQKENKNVKRLLLVKKD